MLFAFISRKPRIRLVNLAVETADAEQYSPGVDRFRTERAAFVSVEPLIFDPWSRVRGNRGGSRGKSSVAYVKSFRWKRGFGTRSPRKKARGCPSPGFAVHSD